MGITKPSDLFIIHNNFNMQRYASKVCVYVLLSNYNI